MALSFFVIGVTSPEVVLALALLGVACISYLRKYRPVIMLLLLNALFIPVMGLLPGVVLHDGVRQLLSALPFLAALAGVGFYVRVTWSAEAAQGSKALKGVANVKSKIIGALFLVFLFSQVLELYSATPSSVVVFSFLGSQARFDVAQALSRGHLGERHREILVDTGKGLDLLRFAIARHATAKGPSAASAASVARTRVCPRSWVLPTSEFVARSQIDEP